MKGTKYLLCAIAAAASVASSNASASVMDGMKLHQLLMAYGRMETQTASGSDPTDAAIAMGYVSGVADSYQGDVVCLPTGATVGQLVAVTKKFLDEHPDQWNLPANLLVGRSLHLAFPCQSK